MWYNDVFFVPPTKSGFSGEVSSLKAKSFGFSCEENKLKPCDAPITGPRR